jgi:hypothetical protein
MAEVCVGAWPINRDFSELSDVAVKIGEISSFRQTALDSLREIIKFRFVSRF